MSRSRLYFQTNNWIWIRLKTLIPTIILVFVLDEIGCGSNMCTIQRMSIYNAVLKSWFKGTVGGSGITTRLESWDEDQLSRYNVDLETYDHTNMSNRPSILLGCYCSQRTPYPTVIFLMDEASDFLLASRHDPLKCERGEPDIDDSVISTVTTPSKSPQKGKLKTTG